MNKAVFLDRDGTIVIDQKYKNNISRIQFTKNAIKGLKILKNLGFLFIIVTNQSGIGKGFVKKKKVNLFNKFLFKKLKKKNILISKIFVCPHQIKDKCKCRKPESKFGYLAKKKFNLDFRKSFMIGDKLSDIKFGKRLGIKTFRINKNKDIYIDTIANKIKNELKNQFNNKRIG